MKSWHASPLPPLLLHLRLRAFLQSAREPVCRGKSATRIQGLETLTQRLPVDRLHRNPSGRKEGVKIPLISTRAIFIALFIVRDTYAYVATDLPSSTTTRPLSLVKGINSSPPRSADLEIFESESRRRGRGRRTEETEEEEKHFT